MPAALRAPLTPPIRAAAPVVAGSSNQQRVFLTNADDSSSDDDPATQFQTSPLAQRARTTAGAGATGAAQGGSNWLAGLMADSDDDDE